ncbi:MAG: PilZ domain-containing protein, partial [Candidatus Acidiferrales bacterium]
MNPIPRRELTRRLRREFARFQFQAKAEIQWQSRKIWASVTDVSRGGLFIEMPEAASVGARFT